MASQFFGLNIAYTGLLASNAALNTTSNNISNVETEGYSRQQVNQEAAEALRTYTTFGCQGAGVSARSIERIRDEFYDVKYWNATQNLGLNRIKKYYMAQIEDYFKDDTSIKGFTTVFNNMYNSLQELAKSAGDTTVKTQMVGYASSLTTYFNEMSSNLTKIQEDANAEIKVKTDEINSLSQEIASLNKQINVIELTGANANSLRDQRSVLVDRLSAVVDVKVTETPIYDLNNPDRETGANRYMVQIAGGQVLVDTNEYRTLKCVARENGQAAYQSDADGLYDIYWESGAEFGMYNLSMGGELAGLIQMRDGNNGEHFNGTVTNVNRDTQGNAYVAIAVTADYLTDPNQSSLPDMGIINIGNTLYNYDSWTFDTTTKAYTFSIPAQNNEAEIFPDKIGRDAFTNQSVEYQGIPYYMHQLNQWVRQFSKAFNSILTQTGSVNEYGSAGQNLFTGSTTDGKQMTFRKEDNITGTISSMDDCYRRLTAANFAISDALIKDSNLLATHTDAQAGQDKSDIIEQLIAMKSDTSKVNFRGSAAGEFLECMLADVALNADRANTFTKNAETMVGSIDNQRISISGVDNDEEAVNLVKFQNAYNLSSKMIQVLTEIYDRLILETGV